MYVFVCFLRSKSRDRYVSSCLRTCALSSVLSKSCSFGCFVDCVVEVRLDFRSWLRDFVTNFGTEVDGQRLKWTLNSCDAEMVVAESFLFRLADCR